MLTVQDIASFWVPAFAAVALGALLFLLLLASHGIMRLADLRAQIALKLDLRYRMARISEGVVMAVVWALPRRIIYWAVVRALAHATTGKWGNEEPGRVTGFDMMERWGGEGR